MIESLILDADICIKIGRFKGTPILELIIPNLTQKAYIHRYVYENEIIIPITAKEQLDNLIKKDVVEIVNENSLNPIEKKFYDATVQKLKGVMIGTKEEGKNWGEVLSLSIAKTMGIPIFMTDESQLQTIINRQLNTGTDNDIKVFRMPDLVKWIKEHPECGFNRKATRAIWCATRDRNYIEQHKEIFNKKLWPN